MSRLPLCLVLATALSATPGAQQQVFRVGLDTVPVFATVVGKGGRLVTDLTQADFEILDNGRRQPVTLFDNSPQPIRLIVMLDTSGSMTGNARLVRAACDELFKQLRSDDQVKIGTFGHEITITSAFTNEIASLRAAVPTEIPDDAPTPLYRALDQALGAFDDGGAGRRVILVLSDGKDSRTGGFGQRYISVLDVIDRAQREDVMVYAIGMESRGAQPRRLPIGRDMGAAIADNWPDPELPRLAEHTGGGYFQIRPRDDLAAAFAQVADELHRQYMLGFVPPAADGKEHKLEVKVRGGGMTARARKNYQAPQR